MLVRTLFSVARTVHDSIDVSNYQPFPATKDQCTLNSEEAQYQVTSIIKNFIRKINFEQNFELQLEVLTNARAAFTNFDGITEELIHQVLLITNKIIKK